MELKELTLDERVTLLGLLKLVIQADREMSKEELAELKKLSNEMGPELWTEARDKAQASIKALEDIKPLVPKVTRPEARNLIYQKVQQMAAAEEVVATEATVLKWLVKVWDL